MPDLSQYYEALQNADKAGDHESAQKIADFIHSQENQAPAAKAAKEPAPAAPAPTGKKDIMGDVNANLQKENPVAPGKEPMGDAGKAIGAATTAGGIAGALAPELMGAAAGVAAAVPGLEWAAGPLATASMAARTARTAEFAIGAMTGMASSTAGQIAKSQGAGPVAQAAVETGVGMGGGVALHAGEKVMGMVAPALKGVWNLARSAAGDVETSSTAAVKAAKDRLAKAGSASVPLNDMHAALAKGAAEDQAASEKAARKILDDAAAHNATLAARDPEAATRAMDEARDNATSIRDQSRERARVLDAATDGKLKTAVRVQALADKELQTVGVPKESSDIGNALRSKVTQQQQEQIAARRNAYKEVEDQRNNVVAQKEAAGQTIDNDPGMKALKVELASKTLGTSQGRAAAGGMANATEPGVKAAYQNVYDSIVNRRVQVGVDADGTPRFQTFKTSFEAIDAVRRKLGDAAFGGEKEGYGALGQKIAKDLYGKIAKIQENFAGPAQKAMQDQYAQDSQGLAKFGTSGGKKLTAVDRVDPETFTKDPAGIPQAFFKTQQGVRDLKELTGGDVGLVEQAAKSYTARQLAGKSAAQAKTWLNNPTQTDWMREVPGLQKSSQDYVRKLEDIERVDAKLRSRAADAQTKKTAVLATGEKEATKAQAAGLKEASDRVSSRVDERAERMKTAEKSADEVRKASQDRAEAVVKKGFPAESVKKLLTSGTPEEIATATKWLRGSPGGEKALDGAVRGILRDTPGAKIQETWQNRLLPALRDGQLVKGPQLEKLQQDVERVISAVNGKDKPTLVARLIHSALATGVGNAAGAVADQGKRKNVDDSSGG